MPSHHATVTRIARVMPTGMATRLHTRPIRASRRIMYMSVPRLARLAVHRPRAVTTHARTVALMTVVSLSRVHLVPMMLMT